MTQEGKRQTIGHMLVWDMKYRYGAWYLLQVVKVGKRIDSLLKRGKQSRNSSLHHTVSRYIARPIREHLSEYSKSK